jgi:hypothetical protein
LARFALKKERPRRVSDGFLDSRELHRNTCARKRHHSDVEPRCHSRGIVHRHAPREEDLAATRLPRSGMARKYKPSERVRVGESFVMSLNNFEIANTERNDDIASTKPIVNTSRNGGQTGSFKQFSGRHR